MRIFFCWYNICYTVIHHFLEVHVTVSFIQETFTEHLPCALTQGAVQLAEETETRRLASRSTVQHRGTMT